VHDFVKQFLHFFKTAVDYYMKKKHEKSFNPIKGTCYTKVKINSDVELGLD